MAAAGLSHAAHQGVAVVPHPAGLVAEDAGPHPLGRARTHQVHQAGLGDLGPGHLDQVGDARGDGLLCHVRVDHAALEDDRHPAGSRVPHGSAQGEVGRRRGMGVWPVGGRRVRAAAHHDQEVDPVGEGVDVSGRELRGYPGPRGELVAREAEADQAPRADRGPHCVEHFPGQTQAVLPVAVRAQVGQAGVELAQQRERPGIHLDPVEARGHRQLRRGGEPAHQCVDLGGSHLHGHLAADHVGDTGRGPEHRLRVGARSLRAAVPDAGEHDGPVRPEGIGDGAPAGAARRRQRGPLVGPVGRVDRGGLGDQHPGAARAPCRVVGHVAVADRATGGKVGLVRTEDHPRGNADAGHHDRVGERSHGQWLLGPGAHPARGLASQARSGRCRLPPWATPGRVSATATRRGRREWSGEGRGVPRLPRPSSARSP